MRFTKFRITNFKGIKQAELTLGGSGKGNIFTLVGLNECGKTTVLEAINSFSPDTAAEPIYHGDVFRRVEHRDLVPKDQKDNFTGDVVIEASLELSDSDTEKISEYFLREHDLHVDLDKLGKNIEIKKVFRFKQSEYQTQQNLWTITLSVKTKKQKKYRELKAPGAVWLKSVTYLRTLIPSICYFPTFLFEFPSRVYLSNTPESHEPQNKYYWQIVQDVLDSLERGLTIEEHIVNRVEKIEDGQEWNFFKFFQSDRKQQVDAVMNHLGNQVTKSVFARWNEIFGSQFTKNIKIEWNVDGSHQKSPIYLSFSVQDGASTYSIAERSLGFRWFFCFLLLTQFRKSRRGSGTLFLLDEPASHLHATAQHQLLSSFESVTDGNNNLIYSTHSHYMINPKWLEGAFIVQNRAIEYDEELSSMHEYHLRETNIEVDPYRKFVGENKDKSTYYQPILDALDYSPSILEHQTKTVMVEGKGDYYVFTYFKTMFFKKFEDLIFLPSSGANDLGPLISLYLGWGYEFKVLLDDDRAGKQAKKRYIEEWYLDGGIAETIGDLASDLVGKRLEGLISERGKDIIKGQLNVSKISKKQLVRFFQQKLAVGEITEFDERTISNFQVVLENLYLYFQPNRSKGSANGSRGGRKGAG